MGENITLSNVELTRFFFALVCLLASAHFFGYLFQQWTLPRVVGEITGGLLLGPTFFGSLFPQANEWLFYAFEAEGKLLSLLYWFGLVLLMFISGFEIEKSVKRNDQKLVIMLVLGSTIIPFIAGWALPLLYDFSPYLGSEQNLLALRIVIAIAVAVTSIPVISKIFIDLNIMNTRFAQVVLSTATIHDVILWVALAIATGLVSSQQALLANIVWTVLGTVLFFGISLFIMPKFIGVMNKLRFNFFLKSSASGYVLLICLLFSAMASLLRVNVVFGAFLAGIVVGIFSEERFEHVKHSIKDISLAFFVPLYFALVGFKLDLIHHFEPRLVLGLLLFMTFFQSVGTTLAAKCSRLDWLSSLNLAMAMNTRGGPGIVLATVAFELGIIDQTFFVTLVLIAILTSLAAGCWFRLVLLRSWELLVRKD